ncbi:histidine phosphatase superfamily protein [Nitzschia inconspicua]|uniref:Histidine phosphatase superfamily protein n=1 Tax=Nitzschia inconspicua TaxID=303405 RepID=A0A9K3M5U9_9STRA|nr:histidine phosphatase superfamily protein [Nitzschia inconspicua]
MIASPSSSSPSSQRKTWAPSMGGFLAEAISSGEWMPSVTTMTNDHRISFCSSYGQLVRLEEDEEEDMDNEIFASSNEEQEILLYLIRHGEAEHNIEEKKAMEERRRFAIEEEGLSPHDPRVKDLMEEARKAVLNDVTLRDAKLSDKGRKEAEEARDKLQRLIEDDNGLVKPDYVLVSPLTRTLETCDILFPDSDNIHVREEISERRTGKPPDTRSSIHWLSLRPSFRRFSMAQLQESVMSKNNEQKDRLKRRCSSGDEPQQQSKQTEPLTQSLSQPEIFFMLDELFDGADQSDPQFSEEDKEQLRARTETLFALLCEANSFSVAVVTHKGYLRELERGPFGHPEATQFDNCEIRVYRITMQGSKLIRAERVSV